MYNLSRLIRVAVLPLTVNVAQASAGSKTGELFKDTGNIVETYGKTAKDEVVEGLGKKLDYIGSGENIRDATKREGLYGFTKQTIIEGTGKLVPVPGIEKVPEAYFKQNDLIDETVRKAKLATEEYHREQAAETEAFRDRRDAIMKAQDAATPKRHDIPFEPGKIVGTENFQLYESNIVARVKRADAIIQERNEAAARATLSHTPLSLSEQQKSAADAIKFRQEPDPGEIIPLGDEPENKSHKVPDLPKSSDPQNMAKAEPDVVDEDPGSEPGQNWEPFFDNGKRGGQWSNPFLAPVQENEVVEKQPDIRRDIPKPTPYTDYQHDYMSGDDSESDFSSRSDSNFAAPKKKVAKNRQDNRSNTNNNTVYTAPVYRCDPRAVDFTTPNPVEGGRC